MNGAAAMGNAPTLTLPRRGGDWGGAFILSFGGIHPELVEG